MKQEMRSIIAAGLAALLPNTASADFYDSVRGPSTAQVHYTTEFSDRATTHTLALKYFGRNVFAVGAASVDGYQTQGGFGGLGAIIEMERVKILPVLGYAISGNGKQGTLKGIAHATIFVDKEGTFLLDPRYGISLPVHGQEEHPLEQTVGATLSLGNERFRLGPDFNYTVGKEIKSAVLVRYDLDAEHTSWLEFGLGTEGSAQWQFRGNF